MTTQPHKYCAAIFCSNNDTNCKLSFFTFPSDQDRFCKWATACGRQDLLKKQIKSNRNYVLCEAHFDDNMFKNRNHTRLQPTALPVKNLADTETTLDVPLSVEDEQIVIYSSIPSEVRESNIKKEWSFEVEEVDLKDDSLQTGPTLPFSSNCVVDTQKVETSVAATQTTLSLTSNSPRKSILRQLIEKGPKKTKSNIKSNTAELSQFKELCDKFLPKKLADFVKVQATLYHQTQRSGFKKSRQTSDFRKIQPRSTKFRQVALPIYVSTPTTYRILSPAVLQPKTNIKSSATKVALETRRKYIKIKNQETNKVLMK